MADCSVKQLGTDLQVVEGRIVEPATQEASNRFNLDRAVVTFPALESGSIPLDRATWPTGHDAPVQAGEHEQRRGVGRSEVGPQRPRRARKSSLNPDWRNLVNGRLVLRGGRVKGLHPSDVVVRDSEFEFRRKDGTPAFSQAITDRVQYDVRVPARQVELLLSGATSKTTRIVIAPESPGRPVILKVIGKHTEHTGEPLPIGSESSRTTARSISCCSRYRPAPTGCCRPTLEVPRRPAPARAAIAWPVLPWRLFLSGVSAMNRWPSCVLSAMLIGAPAVAYGQTQIYPENNAPGGPIVVAVVADHYGPQDQMTFTRDARNVVVRGLLADPDFATLTGQVTVLAYFDPWTGPAESPSSRYGFEVEAGVTNCSISWTANTDALVDNVADDRNPLRTIVVGNYGYVFGCTSGQWTYVTAGAVGQPVLQHEFGHLLARLFDEYVLSANTSVPHPTMIPAADRRNCSTQVPPHWGTAVAVHQRRRLRLLRSQRRPPDLVMPHGQDRFDLLQGLPRPDGRRGAVPDQPTGPTDAAFESGRLRSRPSPAGRATTGADATDAHATRAAAAADRAAASHAGATNPEGPGRRSTDRPTLRRFSA